MKSESVFLLLGSNLGDCKLNLKKAAQLIEAHIGKIITRSGCYQTKPWGKTDQPDFLNQVLQVETTKTPEKLLHAALTIENEMGRTRKEKWGARLIDIDILYVGTNITASEELTLPHPGIANRRFVLAPLTEIAPDFVHPVLKKNSRQLLDECADALTVTKI